MKMYFYKPVVACDILQRLASCMTYSDVSKLYLYKKLSFKCPEKKQTFSRLFDIFDLDLAVKEMPKRFI